MGLLKQTSITLLALSFATVCRAEAPPIDSKEKPGLPPLLLVNPTNVYGDAQTREIERKLLSLLKLAPRPKHGDTSREKSDRIFGEMHRLVGTINSAEELERLAFWSAEADKGWQPDSDLEVVESAFDSALSWIKKKFPSQARARIYELASLVNADGHRSEEIEGHLTGTDLKRPEWSTTCCYVWILQNGQFVEKYNPSRSTVDFNITRRLRQNWYKHWTGKYRFSVRGSFLLQPNGAIKNLKIDKAEDVAGSSREQQQQAQAIARQIITTSAPFPSLPKFRRPLQVQFEFFD